MSPEAQRIAIAEACGRVGLFETSSEWEDHGEGAFVNHVLRDANGRRVPDYLNDLNAMAEAEKVLSDKTDNGLGSMGHSNQRGRYLHNLSAVTGESFPIHATAAQRAEAFLKTLGLWSHGGKET